MSSFSPPELLFPGVIMTRWLTAIVFTACTVHAATAQPADLIVHHGKVITADKADTVATAMAIRGETILAVGSDAEVMKHKGEKTEVIDLNGRAVLPGLMDSHSHAPNAAVTEFDHPVPDMKTIADVLAYVKQRANEIGPGLWVNIGQVFITRLKEQRYPTRAELDAAAPNNPVFFGTGPDASLNTLALKESGITRDREAPPGSKIEKDANGEPTGIVRGAGRLVRAHGTERSPNEQERYAALLKLLKDYNAVGITGIADRGVSPGSMAMYKKMLDKGELPLRVSLSRSVGNTGPAEGMIKAINGIAKEELFVHPHPMLRIAGIKMFLDGGMLTGSAYMREPWGVSKIYSIEDPTYRGIRYIEPEKLLPVVRATIESGLQFTAHSVGDGAVHTLLDAYTEVAKSREIKSTHPCITHCNFMSEEAVKRMAELGVCADIQPAWLYLDGNTLTKQFGYDRMRWFQPLASCFKYGTIVGGGSDHMQKIGSRRSINFYDPWLAMWTALTRRPEGYDGQLHPEEALSRMQVIRYYTINNAWILRNETITGSLESGKQADFIIIDRDLLTCPVDEVKDVQVQRTYVAGKNVFTRR
jgi:hypothetical protein